MVMLTVSTGCTCMLYINQININKTLLTGANPTLTTTVGRTAIGLACTKNNVDILRELLNSCTNHSTSCSREVNAYTGGEAKKWRKNSTPPVDNSTPDGMEGLQWEDEIVCPWQKHVSENETEKEDEWSILYQYYASVIEKTGEMLANTISTREPHCLDAFRKAPIHYAAAEGHYRYLLL